RRDHDEHIRRHFDGIAAEYPRLKARNRFYNDYFVRWCRALVPPGRRVLDLGCGRGDVLAALAPSRGLGVDFAPEMIAHARREHPKLDFAEKAIEDLDEKESFDAAICINTLEYVYDVGAVLDRAHAALRDNGRLLVTTANPLWSPIFQAASKLGLRIPECQRLFITHRDVINRLELHGFEVTEERISLVVPKWSPLASRLV